MNGHGDTDGNIQADGLAGAGARKPDTLELTPHINPCFHLTGNKVSVLIQ